MAGEMTRQTLWMSRSSTIVHWRVNDKLLPYVLRPEIALAESPQDKREPIAAIDYSPPFQCTYLRSDPTDTTSIRQAQIERHPRLTLQTLDLNNDLG